MPRASPMVLCVIPTLAFVLCGTAISAAWGQETPGGPPPVEASPPPITANLEHGNGGTAGGPTGLSTYDVRPVMLVGCMGSSDVPDLFLRNIGNVTIPAGTAIMWLVPEGKREGVYVTPEDIKPGQVVDVSSILASAIGKDQVCLSALRR